MSPPSNDARDRYIAAFTWSTSLLLRMTPVPTAGVITDPVTSRLNDDVRMSWVGFPIGAISCVLQDAMQEC